jgi:hypothetical protein
VKSGAPGNRILAVMTRRGGEEDEEGAAATSPIFCVARNRDR